MDIIQLCHTQGWCVTYAKNSHSNTRRIRTTYATNNTHNIREDLYPTIQIARVLNEIHDRCITERSAYYIVRSKGQIEKEGTWVSNKGKHRQKDKHTDKDRNIKRLVYARYVRLHNPYRQYTNLFIFRFVSEHYVYSAHYVYFIQIKHLYNCGFILILLISHDWGIVIMSLILQNYKKWLSVFNQFFIHCLYLEKTQIWAAPPLQGFTTGFFESIRPRSRHCPLTSCFIVPYGKKGVAK